MRWRRAGPARRSSTPHVRDVHTVRDEALLDAAIPLQYHCNTTAIPLQYHRANGVKLGFVRDEALLDAAHTPLAAFPELDHDGPLPGPSPRAHCAQHAPPRNPRAAALGATSRYPDSEFNVDSERRPAAILPKHEVQELLTFKMRSAIRACQWPP